MDGNPEKALDAVLDTSAISLAKLAVLEKAKSPVLRLEVDNLCEDVKAAYLYSLPAREAVSAIANADAASLEWLEKIGDDEYRRIFGELVDGLIKFYSTLPPLQKKTDSAQGTDGSQS